MKTEYVNLSKYSPIISDKSLSDIIYTEIMNRNPLENQIIIDFSNIKAITTHFGKQVFGRLYSELGNNIYYNHIRVINAYDSIFPIINLGIRFYIEEHLKKTFF